MNHLDRLDWPRTVILSTLLLLFIGELVHAQEQPALVTVSSVQAQELSPSVTAAGTVFSRHEAQLTAGMDARLAWIAEPGTLIEAGDAVARFDCALLSLERDQQQVMAQREEINLQALTREAERLHTLHASLNVSATQLDQVQTDRALAENALQFARLQVRHTNERLSRCEVTAPVTGVMTLRSRHPGEDVERGAVLGHMTDTRHLEVRASVPVRYLPRVLPGSVAQLSIGGLQVQAPVRTVVPAADVQSQTFQARLDLPATAHTFVAAGQLVNLALPLAANNVLTVPRDAVVLSEEGAFVMRVVDGTTAQRVGIELSDAQGTRVAIVGDLDAGDRVVVRGAEALRDGQTVTVHGDDPHANARKVAARGES